MTNEELRASAGNVEKWLAGTRKYDLHSLDLGYMSRTIMLAIDEIQEMLNTNVDEQEFQVITYLVWLQDLRLQNPLNRRFGGALQTRVARFDRVASNMMRQ